MVITPVRDVHPLNVEVIFTTLFGIVGAVISEEQLQKALLISETVVGIAGAVFIWEQFENAPFMDIRLFPLKEPKRAPDCSLFLSNADALQPLFCNTYL